jgi:CHAT domain-containing protein
VTRELLARAGDPLAAATALEALDDILLGPARRAEALAGKRSLIVVPHGALTYLPFGALRNRETGRYLVEDYTLMHLPSAGALPVLRGGSPGPAPTGATSVAFAPFPGALPGTETEAREMERGFGGARVVSGRSATEARVRATLGSAAIVHLATHGVLNARNPLFSRIELVPGSRDPGDDGRLEVHEVDRASIGAGLVFLSGCETALGAAGATSVAGGEDYATLARAFLHAGAGNVIATLWRIEDAGAAAFAKSFYRELARGGGGHGNLTEALALAQREMLRQARYRAPYYWAGYQLSGSGDLPLELRAAQEPRAVSVLGGMLAMRHQ